MITSFAQAYAYAINCIIGETSYGDYHLEVTAWLIVWITLMPDTWCASVIIYSCRSLKDYPYSKKLHCTTICYCQQKKQFFFRPFLFLHYSVKLFIETCWYKVFGVSFVQQIKNATNICRGSWYITILY